MSPHPAIAPTLPLHRILASSRSKGLPMRVRTQTSLQELEEFENQVLAAKAASRPTTKTASHRPIMMRSTIHLLHLTLFKTKWQESTPFWWWFGLNCAVMSRWTSAICGCDEKRLSCMQIPAFCALQLDIEKSATFILLIISVRISADLFPVLEKRIELEYLHTHSDAGLEWFVRLTIIYCLVIVCVVSNSFRLVRCGYE